VRLTFALARSARLIFSAHVGRMICKRVFGFQVGVRSGIFAGAVLVVVGGTPVHAQSGDPISPPANAAGPGDSTPSSDHVRKPTEPPPFDPNRPAARAARAKAPPPATSPRPEAPATPSAGAPQPRRPATTIDPWAEPATAPAPASRPSARQHSVDPWAEPATAPTPVPRPTARPRAIDPSAQPAAAPASASRATSGRRAETPKVIGIDSLGRSSEEVSPEPSPAPRPRRGASSGAETTPADTTDEAALTARGRSASPPSSDR
jgi:translation initiation factor IF-2